MVYCMGYTGQERPFRNQESFIMGPVLMHTNRGGRRARLRMPTKFRVNKIRRPPVSSSCGCSHRSRYVRRFLERMEVAPTVSPTFLVPKKDTNFLASNPNHNISEDQCCEGHEEAPLAKRREGHKAGHLGESKLRHSFTHICPSEECIEALCDINDDNLLEQLVPCASTGLSSAVFIEFIVTGLGSYALSTLKLIDTLDFSLQILGLDISLLFSSQTTS